nr:hypothetical protein CFP56_03767 [Quercus suber]
MWKVPETEQSPSGGFVARPCSTACMRKTPESLQSFAPVVDGLLLLDCICRGTRAGKAIRFAMLQRRQTWGRRRVAPQRDDAVAKSLAADRVGLIMHVSELVPGQRQRFARGMCGFVAVVLQHLA